MPCFNKTLVFSLLTQEPSSIEKIMEIDTHMGCAMSGLTADAKMLIDHARAETQVRGPAHTTAASLTRALRCNQ
jgi:20S proteasome alpha/beta subunit